MAVSLKTKQVAGVTAIVGLSLAILSAFHLASLARVGLEESRARGELLAHAIFQRARGVVSGAPDSYQVLRDDPGIRALLESSMAYGKNVTYAAIVDRSGVAVAHSFPELEGRRLVPQDPLNRVLELGALVQLQTIFSDQILEVAQPVLLGDEPFGAIRIGLSTLLIREDLRQSLRPVLLTMVALLVLATVVATALAQWIVRPIHVIKSGLSRLGRGESGITLDLPKDADFEGLGERFEAISAQLAERRHDNAQASLESVVDYSQKLASLGRLVAGVTHEVKNPLNAMTIHLELAKQKLAALEAQGSRESLVISNTAGAVAPTGSILKLEAFEPGSAGAAATSTLAPDAESPGTVRHPADVDAASAQTHLQVIADEIKRLDEVIQGFLRFIRPEELKLECVALPELVAEVLALVEPEVRRLGIVAQSNCPASLPDLRADPALLRQALLNLALNACHAMAEGGTLRVSARPESRRRVAIEVEDTGPGIPPEHLERIFDLYYTTKERGSGIGLSIVYRIVQLHAGDVEVESTAGVGTRFRLLLPQL